MVQQTTTAIALLAPEIFQDDDNLALWTIQCPGNRALRVDPRPSRRTTPKRSSRDDRSARAGTEPLEATQRSFDATVDPYLQLRFDQKRNSRHGIVLGTAEDCDVRIPEDDDRGRPIRGVSRHHCAITFDSENRIIVRDFSSYGTIVRYGSQGGQRRRNFTWIVSGHHITDSSALTIEIGLLLIFRLIVPEHDFLSPVYIENVRRFLTGPVQSADKIHVGNLEIWSTEDTAAGTGMHTPAPGSIYLTKRFLGKGSYSEVRQIWNVSTGLEYAGKVALNRHEQQMLDAEARLVETLTHDHIVPFRNFTCDPEPMLVLEYAPYGTLGDMMKQEGRISKTQCVEIMIQALSALAYLHKFDKPVVHRDIKPHNILIKSEEPLHIWLADFGFSKASVELTTVCGTPRYKAAEVFKGTYTAAIDVWSLGVVALEMGYELPPWIEGNPPEWSRRLARKARDLPSEPFSELIRSMLSVDPKARPSASACYKACIKIRLPLEPRVAAVASVSAVPGVAAAPRATAAPREEPESSVLSSYKVTTLKRPAASRSSSSQSTPRQTQRPRQDSEQDSEPRAEGWDEDDLFEGNWLGNSMVVGSAVAAMGRESEQWSSSNPTTQASRVSRTSSSHQPAPPHRSSGLAQGPAAPATSSERRMGQTLLRALKE